VIFRVKTDKSKSQKIKFMATGNEYFWRNWYIKLNQVPKQVISAGDVGYLISGIKAKKK
jgi:GTP-binding protein LepA